MQPKKPKSKISQILPILVLGFISLAIFAGCASSALSKDNPPLILFAHGRGESSESDIPKSEPEATATEFEIRRLERPEGDQKENRNLPEWALETIEVRTSSSLPAAHVTGIEGLMIARQSARDAALRELAVKVADLPTLNRDQNVAAILSRMPNKKKEIEKVIRSAEITVEEENPSVSICTARLSLQPIALLLFSETPAGSGAKTAGDPAPKAKNAEIPTEPLKKAEYNRALKDAQRDMQEKIKLVRLSKEETVGGLIKYNKEAAERVRLALEYARVEDIQYPQNNACEVDISLNAAPIISNLRMLMEQ